MEQGQLKRSLRLVDELLMDDVYAVVPKDGQFVLALVRGAEQAYTRGLGLAAS